MTTVSDDDTPRERYEAISVRARGGQTTWYVFDRQTRAAGEGSADEWHIARLVRQLNEAEERARAQPQPKPKRQRRPRKEKPS